MSNLFVLPKAVPVNSGGTPHAAAEANFYATGTTTAQNTFTDSALSTPHANPVVSDSSGVFAPIYLDPGLIYKLTLTEASAGPLIYTVDPVSSQPPPFYSRTAAEITAGVTPTDFQYLDNVLRNGAVGTTGTISSQTAFADAVLAARDGDTIKIPVLPAGEFFYLTAELDTSNKRLIIDAYGAHVKWDVATANQNIFKTGTGGIHIKGGLWEGTRIAAGADNELFGFVASGLGTSFAVKGGSMLLENVDMKGLAGTLQAKYMRQCRVQGGSAISMVTDGNGVTGYYQACESVIVDGFYQKDVSGRYFIHTNNDGLANVNDLVAMRDNTATILPSIRYATRVIFSGGKYHSANSNDFGGGILLTNVSSYIELDGVDVRGASGNTSLGGVLRVTDSSAHIKLRGGFYRSFGGIGHGLDFNGLAPGSYLDIIGPTVIDETGTNTNDGIIIRPSSDDTTYHGQIIATVDGFTNGFVSNPRVNGLTVTVKTINSVTRGIFISGNATPGVSKMNLVDCDCDHLIEAKFVSNVKIKGGRGNKVSLADDTDFCSVVGMTLRMKGTTDPGINCQGDHCLIAINDLESDGTGGTGGINHLADAAASVGTHFIGNRSRGLSQANGWGLRINGTLALFSSNKLDNDWGGVISAAGSSHASPGDNMIANEGAGGTTSLSGTDLSAADLF